MEGFPDVLQNFARFVAIVEFAMTPIPRTEQELEHLQEEVNSFLLQYEQLHQLKTTQPICHKRGRYASLS
jgi:hypothetical protein